MISKAAKERKMREKIEAEMNEKNILSSSIFNYHPLDPKIAMGGSLLIGSFFLYRWLSRGEKVEEPEKKKIVKNDVSSETIREKIVKISPPKAEKKFETLD